MLIRWLCYGNYQLYPPRIWTEGTGGAEYALVFLTKALAELGHQVQVFCDCLEGTGTYDSVEYIPVHHFYTKHKSKKSDIDIIFRTTLDIKFNTDKVVFFSCDQYGAGDWRLFFRRQNPLVCAISQYHASYLMRRYGLRPERVRVVHIGVNIHDYREEPVKEPYHCIYCSQVDRGLRHMPAIWPEIKAAIPQATLTVTGSRKLWGARDNVEEYTFLKSLKDVEYIGSVPRAKLVEEQRRAEVCLFPCSYMENFCISITDAMAAGAVPVTTANAGAVPEVVGDAGILIPIPFDDPDILKRTDEIEMHKIPGHNFGQYYGSFSRAAIDLLQNREQVSRIAGQARARAHDLWTYEKAAERFLKAVTE